MGPGSISPARTDSPSPAEVAQLPTTPHTPEVEAQHTGSTVTPPSGFTAPSGRVLPSRGSTEMGTPPHVPVTPRGAGNGSRLTSAFRSKKLQWDESPRVTDGVIEVKDPNTGNVHSAILPDGITADDVHRARILPHGKVVVEFQGQDGTSIRSTKLHSHHAWQVVSQDIADDAPTSDGESSAASTVAASLSTASSTTIAVTDPHTDARYHVMLPPQIDHRDIVYVRILSDGNVKVVVRSPVDQSSRTWTFSASNVQRNKGYEPVAVTGEWKTGRVPFFGKSKIQGYPAKFERYVPENNVVRVDDETGKGGMTIHLPRGLTSADITSVREAGVKEIELEFKRAAEGTYAGGKSALWLPLPAHLTGLTSEEIKSVEITKDKKVRVHLKTPEGPSKLGRLIGFGRRQRANHVDIDLPSTLTTGEKMSLRVTGARRVDMRLTDTAGTAHLLTYDTDATSGALFVSRGAPGSTSSGGEVGVNMDDAAFGEWRTASPVAYAQTTGTHSNEISYAPPSEGEPAASDVGRQRESVADAAADMDEVDHRSASDGPPPGPQIAPPTPVHLAGSQPAFVGKLNETLEKHFIRIHHPLTDQNVIVDLPPGLTFDDIAKNGLHVLGPLEFEIIDKAGNHWRGTGASTKTKTSVKWEKNPDAPRTGAGRMEKLGRLFSRNKPVVDQTLRLHGSRPWYSIEANREQAPDGLDFDRFVSDEEVGLTATSQDMVVARNRMYFLGGCDGNEGTLYIYDPETKQLRVSPTGKQYKKLQLSPDQTVHALDESGSLYMLDADGQDTGRWPVPLVENDVFGRPVERTAAPGGYIPEFAVANNGTFAFTSAAASRRGEILVGCVVQTEENLPSAVQMPIRLPRVATDPENPDRAVPISVSSMVFDATGDLIVSDDTGTLWRGTPDLNSNPLQVTWSEWKALTKTPAREKPAGLPALPRPDVRRLADWADQEENIVPEVTWAESSKRHLAMLSSGYPNQFGILTAEQRNGNNIHDSVVWHALPFDLRSDAIEKFNYKGEDLQIVTRSGSRYSGSMNRKTGFFDWKLVPVRRLLHKSRVKPQDPQEPQVPAVPRLIIRPDGAVGGVDKKGNLLERELDGTWRYLAKDGPDEHRRAYARMTNGERWGTLVGLAAPIPMPTYSNIDRKENFFTSLFPAFAENYPDEIKHKRWLNWLKVHHPFQKTPNPGKEEAQELFNEARQQVTALQAFVDTPPAEANRRNLDGQLKAAADDKIEEALDLIDQQIVDKNGHYFESYLVRERQDKNVLRTILNARINLLGEAATDDAVVQRLQRMVDAGVFLSVDSDRLLVTRSDGKLGIYKNKVVTLSSMLARYHYCMTEQVRGGMDAEAATSRLSHTDNGNEHTLAVMLNKGLYNTDRILQGMKSAGYAVGAMSMGTDHKMGRAMRVEGVQRYEEPLEALCDFVGQHMEPGEKIVITAEAGGGIDFEGMSQFLKMVGNIPFKIAKALFSAQIAGIEPVNQFTGKRGHHISIEKTHDGKVVLQVMTDQEFTAMPVAFKFQVGAGTSKRVGNTVFFAYAGFNTKPRFGIASKRANAMRIPIKDMRDLKRFLKGEINFNELVNLSKDEEVTSARTKTTTYTADLALEPLAASGIVGDAATHGTFRSQGKFIFAPLVEQIVLSWLKLKGYTKTVGGSKEENRITMDILDKMDFNVGANHITVFEGQGVNAGDVHNPLGTITNGYEDQQKVPAWIWVYMVKLFEKSLERGITYAMKDGTIDAVRMNVSSLRPDGGEWLKDLRKMTMDPNEHIGPTEIPQLQALCATIPGLKEDLNRLKKSGLPISLSMELKPEVIAVLNERGLLQADPETGKLSSEAKLVLQQVLQDWRNLRVTSISCEESRSYATGWSTGITALRYQSKGEFKYSRMQGQLTFDYSGAQPRLARRGPLLEARDKSEPQKIMERAFRVGGFSMFDFVNDPFNQALPRGTQKYRRRRQTQVSEETSQKRLASAGVVRSLMTRMRNGADPDTFDAQELSALHAFFGHSEEEIAVGNAMPLKNLPIASRHSRNMDAVASGSRPMPVRQESESASSGRTGTTDQQEVQLPPREETERMVQLDKKVQIPPREELERMIRLDTLDADFAPRGSRRNTIVGTADSLDRTRIAQILADPVLFSSFQAALSFDESPNALSDQGLDASVNPPSETGMTTRTADRAPGEYGAPVLGTSVPIHTTHLRPRDSSSVLNASVTGSSWKGTLGQISETPARNTAPAAPFTSASANEQSSVVPPTHPTTNAVDDSDSDENPIAAVIGEIADKLNDANSGELPAIPNGSLYDIVALTTGKEANEIRKEMLQYWTNPSVIASIGGRELVNLDTLVEALATTGLTKDVSQVADCPISRTIAAHYGLDISTAPEGGALSVLPIASGSGNRGVSKSRVAPPPQSAVPSQPPTGSSQGPRVAKHKRRELLGKTASRHVDNIITRTFTPSATGGARNVDAITLNKGKTFKQLQALAKSRLDDDSYANEEVTVIHGKSAPRLLDTLRLPLKTPVINSHPGFMDLTSLPAGAQVLNPANATWGGGVFGRRAWAMEETLGGAFPELLNIWAQEQATASRSSTRTRETTAADGTTTPILVKNVRALQTISRDAIGKMRSDKNFDPARELAAVGPSNPVDIVSCAAPTLTERQRGEKYDERTVQDMLATLASAISMLDPSKPFYAPLWGAGAFAHSRLMSIAAIELVMRFYGVPGEIYGATDAERQRAREAVDRVFAKGTSQLEDGDQVTLNDLGKLLHAEGDERNWKTQPMRLVEG